MNGRRVVWTAIMAVTGVAVLAGTAAALGLGGGSDGRFLMTDSSLSMGRLVVVDRDSAWAFGGRITGKEETVHPTAFRWEGGRWQRARLPAGWNGQVVAASATSENDLLGSTDPGGNDTALVHRSADGTWTRTSVGPNTELGSLARIPGTGRLLATGTVTGVFRERSGVLSIQVREP